MPTSKLHDTWVPDDGAGDSEISVSTAARCLHRCSSREGCWRTRARVSSRIPRSQMTAQDGVGAVETGTCVTVRRRGQPYCWPEHPGQTHDEAGTRDDVKQKQQRTENRALRYSKQEFHEGRHLTVVVAYNSQLSAGRRQQSFGIRVFANTECMVAKLFYFMTVELHDEINSLKVKFYLIVSYEPLEITWTFFKVVFSRWPPTRNWNKILKHFISSCKIHWQT